MPVDAYVQLSDPATGRPFPDDEALPPEFFAPTAPEHHLDLAVPSLMHDFDAQREGALGAEAAALDPVVDAAVGFAAVGGTPWSKRRGWDLVERAHTWADEEAIAGPAPRRAARSPRAGGGGGGVPPCCSLFFALVVPSVRAWSVPVVRFAAMHGAPARSPVAAAAGDFAPARL